MVLAQYHPGGGFGTPTYGQTISVADPLGLFLDSFTFSVEISNPQQYQARVYQWDASIGFNGSTIGSPLYAGIVSSIGPTSGFQTITIGTGSVFLPGGNQYALLLTTEGFAGAGSANWGFLSADTYAGGTFVYNNGLIDNDPFDAIPDDLAFSATFTAVPSPLPVAGASAAFAFSRKLRRRIKGVRASGNR